MRKQLKQHCIADLNTRCSNATLIAYKALRVSMDAMQNVLEKTPDTYIIYLVRDPRATVYSTKSIGYMSTWSKGRIPIEAKLLCLKMRHDLRMYTLFQKLYPGAIRLVRYEDLTRYPDKISNDLYTFIGVPRHQNVKQWIFQSRASVSNGGRESVVRSNWTASIEKWRNELSMEDQEEISHYCKDILSILGYL